MFVNLKSKTDFSGFYITFDGSTNLESRGTRGLSHLIEHLICKNFQDLRDEFQRHAIDWNATTSNNNVLFYFTGIESSLDKFRDKLVDRILSFDVTKKDFEIERKIILEEYIDTFNRQTTRHLLNIYRRYVDNYCPIGDITDLKNLKFLDVLNFYEKWYMKPSKIINVSRTNKFEDDSISFTNLNLVKDYNIQETKNVIEKSLNKSDKSSIIFLSELFSYDMQPESISMLKVIAKVLGEGLQSPLYQEVREKRALCYSINSGSERFNRQSLLKIQTITQKKQEDKVIGTIKNILKNPEKFITKDRFNIIKQNLIHQKVKDELNRYVNVQDEISPKEYSIYQGIEKLTWAKLIKSFHEMIKVENFIISSDSELR